MVRCNTRRTASKENGLYHGSLLSWIQMNSDYQVISRSPSEDKIQPDLRLERDIINVKLSFSCVEGARVR